MRIRNWERFQHYKNRNPPWIKLHILVLDDFDWIKWNNDTKVLAVAVMLLAARTENEVPWDKDYLSAVTHVDVTKDAMNVLDLCRFVVPLDKNDSELLADASTALPIACPETEAETDTDKKKRGTRKRATPPPKSFEITDGHREWGKANAPRVDLAAETAKFLDYHTAKGNSLKDWDAAWRNWMRKAVEFKAERAGPEPPPDALPRGHPPHIHPDQYATLDDESKRRAWEAWQTILEKRRQGDAVSTQ
jgi:hypothetical protein